MSKRRSPQRRGSAFQPSLPGLLDSPRNLPENQTRRLVTPGEKALELASKRMPFLTIIFFISFLVVGGRLGYLTLLTGQSNADSVVASQGTKKNEQRADVTDRNGTLLATSLPLFSFCADGPNIIDPNHAAEKILAVIPDIDKEKMMGALTSKRRCAAIGRHLTPNQYYLLNKQGIAGIEFLPEEGRSYPNGHLASHLVGFTDIDNRGIAGIERSMNDSLSSQDKPVQLALDLRLQTILFTELDKGMKTFDASGAAGLILDIKTGEILSIISLPDFDPTHAGLSKDNEKFNRATLGVYEMGSTFKTFNTAMALDSGLVRLHETFDVHEPLRIAGKTIRDFHPSKTPLNVAEILVESSNIGSARMAQRLGGSRQKSFLTRLGLTERLDLEISEVGRPLVPEGKHWGEVATMTISFGHGIAVNAVQVASAFGAIVNDGILVPPTLLKRTEAELANVPMTRVISSHTSAVMRALLRLVVTDGTGKSSEAAGYLVGGKTGTADKSIRGQYNKDTRLSSFVGAFPMQAPRYVVFALLDNPNGTKKTHGFATAGWTAAPMVGRIIEQAGPMLGIAPLEGKHLKNAERKIRNVLGGHVLERFRLRRAKDKYKEAAAH